MKNFFLPLIALLLISPVKAEETITINVNYVCANIVGIPYASDNFSDEEWEKFKQCLKYFKQFDRVYTN